MARGEPVKTTADIVAEVSHKHAQAMSSKDRSHQAEKSALQQRHRQEVAHKENVLCIQSWGQLAMMAGAATMGLVAGNAAVRVLDPRWRLVPVAGGLGLVYLGWRLRTKGRPFATQAAVMLGGAGLIAPVIRVQLEERYLPVEDGR